MVNPGNNGTSGDAVTRPAFGHFMIHSLFMFNCILIMNMSMFNSCLNMNTCTCYVALTMLFLLKYLFNHGINIYRLITYYLTRRSTVPTPAATAECGTPLARPHSWGISLLPPAAQPTTGFAPPAPPPPPPSLVSPMRLSTSARRHTTPIPTKSRRDILLRPDLAAGHPLLPLSRANRVQAPPFPADRA
jgi:hypothetical protein